MTVEEGGFATQMKVWPSGILIFGLGNGSVISSVKDMIIDDGATIEVEPDPSFTPVPFTAYDLVMTSAGLSVTPGNLMLTTGLTGGLLQEEGTGKKPQFVAPETTTLSTTTALFRRPPRLALNRGPSRMVQRMYVIRPIQNIGL